MTATPCPFVHSARLGARALPLAGRGDRARRRSLLMRLRALTARRRATRSASSRSRRCSRRAVVTFVVLACVDRRRRAPSPPALDAGVGRRQRSARAARARLDVASDRRRPDRAGRPVDASRSPACSSSGWRGVAVLSVRLARRLDRRPSADATRAVSPVGAEIRRSRERVAGASGARSRRRACFESSARPVPVMVGWLKPVVLLPAAALVGSDADADRGAARARARARPAPRLPRQPAAVGRRDAAVLSPGRLVGVAAGPRRARALL